MTRLQQVQVAIEGLSAEDYDLLRRWFADREWKRWDREIKRDSADGKLDFLIEEATAEKASGLLRDL